MSWKPTVKLTGRWAQTAAPAVTPQRLFERALTLAAMGSWQPAMAALREVTARAPDHGPAWDKLAEGLRLAGKEPEARAAAARAAQSQGLWPSLADTRTLAEIDTAEAALRRRMAELEQPAAQFKALRERLNQDEADIAAMRLLARLEWRRDNLAMAETLFQRALDLAPQYLGARADLARLLAALNEDGRAVAETSRLVAEDPENLDYRTLHFDALRAIGNLSEAVAIIEGLAAERPDDAHLQSVLGQALHYAGRRDESSQAFRAALRLNPGCGEAYWGLAELRGGHLTAEDITAMRLSLGSPDQEKPSRMLMSYALGRALEQTGDLAGAFASYQGGASLAREIAAANGEIYDPAQDEAELGRRRAVFTPSRLERPSPPPAEGRPTPIFVLGMPRAGSTLVEQILASHTQVEATMELPVLGNIVRNLSLSRRLVRADAYPECLAEMSEEDLAALGARYLEGAAAYRRTDRPVFVDKRPWNWREVGLIAMILPGAKIIDVRRQPLAACFAMYKQMLARDAAFSNDFRDLADYYTNYVSMMDYYTAAAPRRIHFLSYDQLVEDTEAEIRRLLDYCGLPFEESCLRFWENDRAVATPSAEQVRRPIFRDALTHWRRFEPWLGPLKAALAHAEAQTAGKPAPDGYDRAVTLAAMSCHEAALEELRAVTNRVPEHTGAWRALAGILRLAGKDGEAQSAEQAASRGAAAADIWRSACDRRPPQRLTEAERGLAETLAALELPAKMEQLRNRLFQHPADAAAAHLLARMEWDDGDEVTALTLLERSLELAPQHHAARANLASLLMRRGGFIRALAETTKLVRDDPGPPEWRALHADALQHLGEYTAALAVRRELAREDPENPRFQFGQGTLLQALGRRAEAAGAFRTSLGLAPDFGQAWWGLADLKADALGGEDIAKVRERLADSAVPDPDRMYMAYAVGHALERRRDFAGSFAAYNEGARLFRNFYRNLGEGYDEPEFLKRIRARKSVFTPSLLSRGAPRDREAGATPIFVIGMPRAGSTLVEQILASHGLIEGTRELPLVGDITRALAASRRLLTPDAYPSRLLELGPADFAALGERLIAASANYRKTDCPYFVDKRPWNWLEVGLIHLILPNAKIIDIRREPMAACFSMFKQVLPADAAFSYHFGELGSYYNIYVSLMNHWASVLPGRVHFVRYERLVEDTEGEVRRLLDYCGLPFDPNCLRFWETDRAVSTPSAEQVRQPIFRAGLEQWRHYEPWLRDLKAALAEPARA